MSYMVTLICWSSSHIPGNLNQSDDLTQALGSWVLHTRYCQPMIEDY